MLYLAYLKIKLHLDYLKITGKLMWNDTTMDGIDKLGLKTVYLSSPSGNFSDNNPVLKMVLLL